LDGYEQAGNDVALLVLLPETVEERARTTYPTITYAEIAGILQAFPLKPDNHYHFLILEYLKHIEVTTGVYAALLQWMSGHLTMEALSDPVTAVLSEQATISDNEIRTYSLFYYFHLREFIRAHRQSLVFGTLGYKQALESGDNTDWIYQKNMQGPP